MTTDTTSVPGTRRVRLFTHGRLLGHATLNALLNNIVWILLLVLTIGLSLGNPFFWSIANFKNILIQGAVLGIVAIGLSHTMIVGEIDLSVTGTMGIAAAIGGLLVNVVGAPVLVGIGATLLIGALIGLVNGLAVTKLKMVSLIETLAMMITLQGALLAISRGKSQTNFPAAYTYVGHGEILGIPMMTILFLAVYAVVAVVFGLTPFGRSLFAVGGNPIAAHVSGIRVVRTKVLAFVISGVCAAFGGYLLAAWLQGITAVHGQSILLYAIAAPVIGGVSTFGGRGSVLGILGGVLLLTVIETGLVLVGIPDFYVNMVGGLMIFLAVIVDALRSHLVAR